MKTVYKTNGDSSKKSLNMNNRRRIGGPPLRVFTHFGVCDKPTFSLWTNLAEGKAFLGEAIHGRLVAVPVGHLHALSPHHLVRSVPVVIQNCPDCSLKHGHHPPLCLYSKITKLTDCSTNGRTQFHDAT